MSRLAPGCPCGSSEDVWRGRCASCRAGAAKAAQAATPQERGLVLEALAARTEGAVPRRGSGAVRGRKGDWAADGFLTEHKATERASYRLTLRTWRKIEGEARAEGLEPRMVLDVAGVRLEVRGC